MRRPRPAAERARERLWASQVVSVPTPAGTIGHSFAVDADGVTGLVLVHGAELAHLAVSMLDHGSIEG